MQKIIFYILFLLNNYILFSQESFNDFRFTNPAQLREKIWTIEDGLPSLGILDILQTPDGYLWMASYEGLIRYDGFDFKLYNSTNTPVFSKAICQNLYFDGKQYLWILFNNDLLYYRNGVFKRFNLPDSLGKIHQPGYMDHQDRFWLFSPKKGLFYIKDFKIHTLPLVEELTNVQIKSIVGDSLDNIYIITFKSQVLKYNGKHFILLYTSLSKEYFSKMHLYKNKIYWCNEQNHIYSTDGIKVKRVPDILVGENIDKINVDRNGNRWIITDKKIYKQDAKNDKLIPITAVPNKFIYKTYLDFEGNLWVSIYREGLKKVSIGKFDIYNENLGLRGKIVNTVCEIGKDSVLVGCNNGCVDLISKDKIIPYKQFEGQVLHILKDRSQNLWFSTTQGVVKIAKSGKKRIFNLGSGLSSLFIREAYQDKRDNIWLGTNNRGIIRIDKNDKVINFPFQGKLGYAILSFNEDKEDRLLISSAIIGLFHLNNQQLEQVLPDSLSIAIFNTYLDKDSVLWIASNAKGFYRLKNNEITIFNSDNGLFDNSIFDIIEDNNGNFWLPFNRGFMCVSKKELNDFAAKKIKTYHVKLFYKKDVSELLMPTPTAKCIKTQDGRLWFPSLNGLIVINPDSIRKNKLPPKVNIEYLLADKDTLFSKVNNKIPAGYKHFLIKFTAISFRNPEKIHFKYKLEGFDKEWIETDYQTRKVVYTNLKHGSYTFKVKACNNDEVWNEKGAKISFKISPFVYETFLFNLLLTAIILILLWIAYKLRVKKLKENEIKLKKIVKERTALISSQKYEIEIQKEELEKHKNHLEELVKKRTKQLEKAKLKAEESDKLKTAFLNNMSHEIRTPLNGIIGFTQILEIECENTKIKNYINIISQSTSQLLTIVDDIIYISKIQAGIIKPYLKPTKVNALLNSVYQEVKQKASAQKLELRMKIPNHEILINTDFDKLKQILLILLENSIKFTNKGFVEFGYLRKDKLLEFYVKDSGIGIKSNLKNKIFDKFRQIEEGTTRVYGGLGLGLSIARAYVELLGGEIWFKSKINEGSIFFFTISKKIK